MQNIDTATEETLLEARRNIELMRGIGLKSKDPKERAEDEIIFTSVYATHAWKAGSVVEAVPITRAYDKDEERLPDTIRKLLVAWPAVKEGEEKKWAMAYGFFAFYKIAPTPEGGNVRYEPNYEDDVLNLVATRGLSLINSFILLSIFVCLFNLSLPFYEQTLLLARIFSCHTSMKLLLLGEHGK